MMRGPVRSIAWGGIAFGVALVVLGTLFLLINQEVIKLEKFDFWTVCFSGLIVLGIIIIGGGGGGRRAGGGGGRRGGARAGGGNRRRLRWSSCSSSSLSSRSRGRSASSRSC